ncbi:MAG: GxxExxY protein [Acidobacteriota bacterium]|nr:GxxExxY protein [Acidobacteriota bacterium]MDH3529033.1 GxxExxY protein [Acidobacteriota bacterium]
MKLNEISGTVIGCAIKVHRTLGPGLLESAYEGCLVYELSKEGLNCQTQMKLPVIYDGVKIDTGYRVDVIVAKSVILEIKTVKKIIPIHEAQILSYLKMSRLKLGLILNFNTMILKSGIKRIVNNFDQ